MDKLISKIKDGDSDEQKELLKQLQEENLHLRIENAFLKEVRRLRLEENALLKNSENRPQLGIIHHMELFTDFNFT